MGLNESVQRIIVHKNLCRISSHREAVLFGGGEEGIA